MEEKALTANEVRTWLGSVEHDLHGIKSRVAPLLAEQRRLEERQSLLEGLLRSFDKAGGNGSAPVMHERAGGSVGAYVSERAAEILREEGRPLHINDLHAQFLARGFAIPGAGKSANLIVHLRNADEIVSPQRGVYGLLEQVGAVSPRPSRRKKRKARATPARRVSG